MYKIGIDVGGTFTDAVSFDEGGEIKIFKASTTPEDLSIGVMDCLKQAAEEVGLNLQDFLGKTDLIAHGTTVTTNTVLTLSGAKVGTISTKGFRDVLEIRRGLRPAPYYVKTPPAPVLSPRYLREEVEERVLYTGEIETPLDEDSVRMIIRKFKEKGVESIAVSLLFSFANPKHERRIGEIIAEEWPEVYVALSFEVLPQVREYERTSTTVLDAYVGPILYDYIKQLHEKLSAENFTGELLLMQSNGGVQRWDMALKKAVGSINSGPAAASPASLFYGEMFDYRDILSIDMGGTSFDVGLIGNGQIHTTTEGWIGLQRNALPTVDVHTIGAGGGSIAWLDPNGLLCVGPKSAGAVPGPACYGRGGTEPTVTDANLVLGYLNPAFLLGGRLKTDLGAAKEALGKLAQRLGTDIVEVSDSIFNIVNQNMINAIMLTSIRRGYDPRDFALVVGGGAGAAHAARIAEKLEIPRVIIPKQAPVFCALGLILSDLMHTYVRSHIVRLGEADLDKINQIFEEMEKEGAESLRAEGVPADKITFRRSAEMRYVRQHQEIEIDWLLKRITSEDRACIEELFHQRHDLLFSFSTPGRPVEIMTLKVVALGSMGWPVIKKQQVSGDKNPAPALKTRRKVFFTEEKGFVEAPIFDGDLLKPGNVIEGPAVVEEMAMTVVIPPTYRFKIDQYGNYVSI